MDRVWRGWVIVSVACIVGLLMAPAVSAATATVSVLSGPLTIAPAVVRVSYTYSPQSDSAVLTSTFALTVTDSTGSKAGWEIQAAVTDMTYPASEGFPSDNHLITNVGISGVTGSPPIVADVSNWVPLQQSMIFRAAPGSGMGRSTETFSTQLTLPYGSAPGTYSATLTLATRPIGSIRPVPPVGRAGGTTVGDVPAPAPVASSRSASANVANPDTLPQPAPSSRTVSNATSPLDASASDAPNQSTGTATASTPARSSSAAVSASLSPTGSPNAESLVSTAPAIGGTNLASPRATAVASSIDVRDPVAVTPPNVAPTAASVEVPPANPPVPSRTRDLSPVVTVTDDTVMFTPPLLADTDGARHAGMAWHLQAGFSLPSTGAGLTDPIIDAGTADIVLTVADIAQTSTATIPVLFRAGVPVRMTITTASGHATISFDRSHTVVSGMLILLTIVAGP